MESVTKHDTSLLKLQGPRTPPHACNSAWMWPRWKQLGNRVTAENMQSGASSCFIDMLIARSMCKHVCSFTQGKHWRRNYVPQRKPVIKLHCTNVLGCEQWLQWVIYITHKTSLVAAKCITSECRSRNRTTTHAQHQISERSLQGNIQVPRKLGCFCHFHYS